MHDADDLGSPSARPVIAALRDIEKRYAMGEVETRALAGVNLDVHDGEFIAIVGTSGSGKSTLLHILGCLDAPSAGVYELLGHDVASLDVDQRATLRGVALGFVFQGFHLLQGHTALENVELPLVYRGVPAAERLALARAALARVGLSDRAEHKPTQLSGGQQQRVAIARALVTEPRVLFADEPTGNLDSRTTEELLGILQGLHAEGLTIVLVTHDPEVARAATRVVTMNDGTVASDSPVVHRRVVVASGAIAHADVPALRARRREDTRGSIAPLALLTMGLRLAAHSLSRSKLRTGLTTLGILIGIAAVVTTSGLGAGARERMEQEMLTLGANMIVVMPGATATAGARGAQGSAGALDAEDARAIAKEVPSVKAAAPVVSTSAQVVRGALNASTRVSGTTPEYLEVRSWKVAQGSAFDARDLASVNKLCLIGKTVERNLFAGESAVGKTLRVGRMPCTVAGVLAAKGQTGFGQDQDDVVLVPLTTFQAHIARRSGGAVDQIAVSAIDANAGARAERSITDLLRQRHHIRAGDDDDFSVRNLSELSAALETQRAAITMLLLVVASVSLLVGGIGVMNIMLVSVTERTREIGIRLAIGGRPRDILTQFLLEAVVLAIVGGMLGLGAGAAAGFILDRVTDYAISLQWTSALVAIAISCGIGVVFGFLPARRAAALDPISALRND